MNYIVLDLEWNQGTDGKSYKKPDLSFEIVEIGAIKLDENRQFIDTFHALIKPSVYLEINSHIEQVTHVSMKDLEQGTDFKTAATTFLDWCGSDYRFCTWGSMDLTELQRNMTYFQVERQLKAPLFYYDLQKLYSISFSDGKTRSSLENAVDALSIEKLIPFHRADADTFYTVLVMRQLDWELISKNFSIDYYHVPQSRKEEIYVTFSGYSKHVSRSFPSREAAMKDKGVTTTSCYLCRKNIKKKIRWFSYTNRMYYSLMYCDVHGYIKGKIRLKKTEDNRFFAIKTIKLTDEFGANEIYRKHQEMCERRKKRLER